MSWLLRFLLFVWYVFLFFSDHWWPHSFALTPLLTTQPNAKSTLGFQSRNFICFIYHEITREQATPVKWSNRISCQLSHYFRAPEKWGTMYKSSRIPKCLMHYFCETPLIYMLKVCTSMKFLFFLFRSIVVVYRGKITIFF